MRDELLSPEVGDDDVEIELRGTTNGLRPTSLAEFVGQAELKDHLEIILGAARKRGQAADHLLFAGPPGLGKTTLAHIVATEMGVVLHSTSGPALERAGDLAAILTKLDEGDVLFIDEIHRLSRNVEEVLYPAMEDFQLDIVLGKGPAARSVRLPVARFTLVGATTRTGLITGPLRDRFGLVARLDYYNAEDLDRIVVVPPRSWACTFTTPAASRSPASPRHPSNRQPAAAPRARLRRDEGRRRDRRRTAHDGLATFGVDAIGLDKIDRAILIAMCERFGGGPVGLSTLAISVSEPTETVEDVYEPFLIQQGSAHAHPAGSCRYASRVGPPRSHPATQAGREPPGGLFD